MPYLHYSSSNAISQMHYSSVASSTIICKHYWACCTFWTNFDITFKVNNIICSTLCTSHRKSFSKAVVYTPGGCFFSRWHVTNHVVKKFISIIHHFILMWFSGIIYLLWVIYFFYKSLYINLIDENFIWRFLN